MMDNHRQAANKVNNTRSGAKGITALYSRLSREDDLMGESLSITNQREILESYAKGQGFSNIVHFCDDDVSGTRFDRDAWQELIAEVEAGNVLNCVLKDMSRWGRDHVQVGMYMELFRKKGVRFIAISNGIDSLYPETLEFAPFINIMNEWFARDTSRKIKTVAHARGNAGKPLSYTSIYGYRKSPGDKHKWLVDEIPAAVVRRVFQMTIDGMGPSTIARALTGEKVEKPSYYFAMNRMAGGKPSSRDLTDPYTWSGSTIAAMLKKPEYCGHTINFRTYKESYKDKQSKQNPQEKWKVFPDTHEAIIDQGTFDTVQRLRGTPRRADAIGEANPLTGIVYCADCNAKMYNSRQSKEYYEEKRHGKVYRHKTSDHYTCSTHSLGTAAFKTDTTCSSHFIRTSVIRDLVLDAIRRVSAYVNTNEAEFIEKIREASAIQQEESAKAHRKQIAKNHRRIAELDNLFRKVYEDNAAGKLSDERYEMLSVGYEQEQAALKQQTAALQAELDAYTEDSRNAGRFIEVARRYTEFGELTNSMLNEFVHRILVHEADKSSGERTQQVDICFNFIANFDVPSDEAPPTAEELAAQAERRAKLAKQREYNRNWYAKNKAEAEHQQALDAGEIPAEEIEAAERERLAQERAAEANREERETKRREYQREWMRQRRERERAERSKQTEPAVSCSAADTAATKKKSA